VIPAAPSRCRASAPCGERSLHTRHAPPRSLLAALRARRIPHPCPRAGAAATVATRPPTQLHVLSPPALAIEA